MNKEKSLTIVKGFKFAGIIAGDKNKKNIGLIYSTVDETYGVAVYTKSDILAASVILSKNNDKITNKKRAVLINSGNANAFTGKKGIMDAQKCISKVSELLCISDEEVYLGSTGVIGRELELDIILKGIDNVIENLDTNDKSAIDFIESSMTTDTKVKQACISFELDGKTVNIAACVKGAGMIMPDMATMLSVVITDAKISPSMMQKALKSSVEKTYNCITIDGDTSTNDSVFLLANGLAGNNIISSENENYHRFADHLNLLLEQMAKEVVNDGEGITKFITIKVINTPTKEKGKTIAMSIANSPLVKTTFYGQQLNWGRLLMAIGKAQTRLDCSKIDIFINNYKIVSNGEPALNSEEYIKAEESLKERNIDVLIDFKQGESEITIWTCDFSIEYVKINGNYLT
ncbi:bifunctional glutamate N-acetyltransferase/amino-acid acetyltransferase ArgJ [Pelosinus fermentans]|uniref:Arginine biosynthesis bifunctional protein ArgJ n=1 Tax=Pelosinus fermentans JBW45 TaxID=1192197 RepID=I9NR94_9FIRM|nr:bifunctional glutamate N-acetyltransferase/amino-acid acetyltransferase ArgJ [Pelosinus fermentans]AJQ26610.1 Arginine biosynthesis bifunctional protein ArgJ [Pelosinus fermentans JBW45]